MGLSIKSAPRWTTTLRNPDISTNNYWVWFVKYDDRVLAQFTCRKAARAYLEWMCELPHEVIENRIKNRWPRSK